MKTLYRRYRPTKLTEVVGQPQVTDVIAAALEQGKISHAYLFIGPRGTGKTSVARIFAHEVNGFPYEVEDDYVDIVEIDGASNRGIDDIRELREKAAIAPTAGKYKIYIIDEVHMLTKEAFNALLKTLEEPPEHVIFIMATTDAHKVPVTITSRAQTYTFRLVEPEVMLKHLRGICEKEGIKISDEALELVVKRGGGSFRDSLSLLDQISTLSDSEITLEMVTNALGLPSVVKITTLLEEFSSGNVVKITTLLKELLSEGAKAETVVEELISQIVAEPKAEYMGLLAKLTEVKAPFVEAKLLVALIDAPSARVAGNTFFEDNSRLRGSETYIPDGPERFVREADGSLGAPAYDVEERAVGSEKGVPDRTRAAEPKDFDWDKFVQKIRKSNEVIYNYLSKAGHDMKNGAVNIYPHAGVVKNILESANNKKLLIDAAGGMRIEIHNAGEKPENAAEDELISKISGIMGGEVVEDGGGEPF